MKRLCTKVGWVSNEKKKKKWKKKMKKKENEALI